MTNLVDRVEILSSNDVVYSAWEPCEGLFGKTHQTLKNKDGEWYGDIATRKLPSDLEALTPYSKERAEKVSKWREEQYQEAYTQIFKEFPDLQNQGRKVHGRICTVEVQK